MIFRISRPPATLLRLFVARSGTRLPKPAALLLSLATLLLPGTAALGEAFDTEDDFVRYLHQQLGGEMEVTLPDRTRVDLLTRNHALEVHRARKWAQAIGQSLHYARITNRQPAIVLLTQAEDRGDRRGGRKMIRKVRAAGESFIPGIPCILPSAPESGAAQGPRICSAGGLGVAGIGRVKIPNHAKELRHIGPMVGAGLCGRWTL